MMTTVQFSAPLYSIGEKGGSATITAVSLPEMIASN
jgi:hypothetical protein